ncbi:MAG: ABC transporter substrate-binding protein [Candidatus Dormibacteraeota bacterium]|nr:ABC transporter substrate-binding protein [Candidatus Dormibacteraeota bacterium]
MTTVIRPQGHEKARFTGLVSLLAIVITACGTSSATPSASDASAPAAKGGSATVGMAAGDIDHLEPTLWYFAQTWEIAYAICTPLVNFPDAAGQPGAKVVGGIADMPTISPDGLTYTFKLRAGIKFSNGQPITADDVQYTFVRMLSPSLGSPATGFFSDIVGAPDVIAGTSKTLTGVVAAGNAVTITLLKPLGSMLYRLTMPFTCTVPKGTVMSAVEDGSLPSTGPYMIQSYTPNRLIVMVRNPNYNSSSLGARGKLDQITLKLGVDPAQAGLLIRSGDLATYIDRLASADATQALQDQTLKGRVFVGLLPSTIYMWLNNDVAPFDNPLVRRAVNYAINRAAILRVWGGPSQGSVTDQVLSPTMPGWKKADLYPAAGDPAKATQLLAQAGVTLPVHVLLRVRNDAAGFVEMAQVVQAELKAVGIIVDIKSAPDSVNVGIVSTRANHIAMGIQQWTQDYPDPDDFFGTLLDGNRITPTGNNNLADFNDPATNQAIEAMDNVSGQQRATRWNTIDAQAIGQLAPWAPLLNPTQVVLLAKGICGYVFQPVYVLDLNTLGKCP